MKNTLAEKPPLWVHQDELLQPLITTSGLNQLKEILKGHRILATFDNGYGVIINPVLPEGEEELFDLIILRFYGAGILDHRVAQYLPIPEWNRGDFEATIDLCLQVSRLLQRGKQPAAQDAGGPQIASRLTLRDDYPKNATFPGSALH
jgi:hypothetical protein